MPVFPAIFERVAGNLLSVDGSATQLPAILLAILLGLDAPLILKHPMTHTHTHTHKHTHTLSNGRCWKLHMVYLVFHSICALFRHQTWMPVIILNISMKKGRKFNQFILTQVFDKMELFPIVSI